MVSILHKNLYNKLDCCYRIVIPLNILITQLSEYIIFCYSKQQRRIMYTIDNVIN